jgi:hypothetical protein
MDREQPHAGGKTATQVRALSARIARQLEKEQDGLCLDNAAERRKLARWIAAGIVTGRFDGPETAPKPRGRAGRSSDGANSIPKP